MDFFTRCCRRVDPLTRGLPAFLLACWLGVAGSALAGDKSLVRQAAIQATPQGYALDADVSVTLNPTLEDALSKGINLYFLLELELTRPRGWWFDEVIAEPVRKMRIYYHLLLRRFVVESGYTTRTFTSLAETLAFLGRIEGWQILERGALEAGKRYDARLRLRLNTAQLPKPLSIGAVTSDKWELATPWFNWSFEAPATPVPPVQSLP